MGEDPDKFFIKRLPLNLEDFLKLITQIREFFEEIQLVNSDFREVQYFFELETNLSGYYQIIHGIYLTMPETETKQVINNCTSYIAEQRKQYNELNNPERVEPPQARPQSPE